MPDPAAVERPMSWFRRAFSIDPRSLALFRIALATTLLGDLATRIGDLEAWYTDFGIMPRADLPAKARWSLHALGGSVGYEAFLFALAALAAVALLIGLFPRVALFVCWVLTLSMLARNSEVQGATAAAIRVAMLWGFALPLGARWSIDRAREAPSRDEPGEAKRDTLLFSVATFAILLQVFLIYPLTLYGKLKQPCCWRNLSAVHQILYDDRVATWLNPLFRRINWAHRPMAAAVLVLEGVPPFFALLGTPRIRTGATLAMMTLHGVLIPSAVSLGFIFPAIMVTLWTLYLPPWFWDEALPRAIAFFARKMPRAHARLVDLGRWSAALVARIPRKTKPRSRRFDATFGLVNSIVVGFGVVFWLVSSGSAAFAKRRWSPPLSGVARMLGLSQTWALYIGRTESHQYVFAATLRDGTRVDLRRNGAPLDWKRNADRAKNAHWTKYETNVSNSRPRAERYSDYLARRWDRDHPDNRLQEIELVVRERRAVTERWRNILLWQSDLDPTEEPRLRRANPRSRVGSRVGIDVDARTLAERRCKLPGKDAGCADEDDPLVPFVTAAGAQFLARASVLRDFRRHGRIAVRCALEDRSTAKKALVKFTRESPWLETKNGWTIGTLSCARGKKQGAR